MINRSHKYKNKYVHRRTSVSLENLSQEEVEDRRRLGLVRFSLTNEDRSRSESEDSGDDGAGASSEGVEFEDAEGHSHVKVGNHKPNF